MGSTWDLQVRVAKGILVLNFAISILGLIFLDNPKTFITGIVFGSLIAILNFRLLALTTEKAVKLPEDKARTYAASRYVIRYIISGLVIFVSLKAEHINALGTVIGLISIKPIVFKEGLFNDKNFFKKIFIKTKRKEEN